MFLGLQDQVEALTKEVSSLDQKMQLMLEQLVLSKQERFGRSSEKMDDHTQICFMEVDGEIVFFNEAEAVCDLMHPNRKIWKFQKHAERNRRERRTKICPFLPTIRYFTIFQRKN